MKKTNTNRYAQCGLAIAAAMASINSADAASIAWGGITAFDDATDVLNTNDAVEAVGNFGTASTTINGVVFTDNNSLAAFASSNNYGTGFFNGAANTGDAGFDDLVGGQFWNNGGPSTATLTLNVEIGKVYQFQYIIMDGRGPGNYTGRTAVLGDGDGDASNDSAAVSRTNGTTGNGNSITGTFTADAITQDITLTGSDVGLTGYVLRVTPVPEPSSTALLGLGGLALILRRRR